MHAPGTCYNCQAKLGSWQLVCERCHEARPVPPLTANELRIAGRGFTPFVINALDPLDPYGRQDPFDLDIIEEWDAGLHTEVNTATFGGK